MLLQEPAQSPYDVRFQLLGFPIRVSWSFWVASAVFGYAFAQGLDSQFGLNSPGVVTLLLLWGICLFVSIVIHEMGHALAFRQNKIESGIVLYFLGGLAIPRSSHGSGRLTPMQSMWIATAGPLAQFSSAMVVIAAVRFAGYRAPVPWPLTEVSWLNEGAPIGSDSIGLAAMVTMYVYPSILWAILNLVPVWPLDGGRIMSSFVQMLGGTMAQSLWVSVVAALLMGIYGFTSGNSYLGFMFLFLGFNNYQAIQQYSDTRY
jgi:stage IV sporulation protein FB